MILPVKNLFLVALAAINYSLNQQMYGLKRYSAATKKAVVDQLRCYGCGIDLSDIPGSMVTIITGKPTD